jgi:hypothetical protein
MHIFYTLQPRAKYTWTFLNTSKSRYAYNFMVPNSYHCDRRRILLDTKFIKAARLHCIIYVYVTYYTYTQVRNIIFVYGMRYIYYYFSRDILVDARISRISFYQIVLYHFSKWTFRHMLIFQRILWEIYRVRWDQYMKKKRRSIIHRWMDNIKNVFYHRVNVLKCIFIFGCSLNTFDTFDTPKKKNKKKIGYLLAVQKKRCSFPPTWHMA